VTNTGQDWQVFTENREAVIEELENGRCMAFFPRHEAFWMGLQSFCFVLESWIVLRPFPIDVPDVALPSSSSATRWCIVLCSG
jgi:hypothetical protein